MTNPSDSVVPAFWSPPAGARLPRVALMGEFSAGKSTLANLMIESRPLPEQVVATQLPPVWVSFGDQDPVLVDLEGNEAHCAFENLQEAVNKDTAFVRVFGTDEILSKCEIIDMPGISDPNTASIVWERLMPFADGVIWCTPATQAWRQSEAAVWEGVDETIRKNSMLVVTRADMLLTERDRKKVFTRVHSEAGALFSDMTMMSLIQARDAKEDEALWGASGADEFVSKFLEILERINAELPRDNQTAGNETVLPTRPVKVADVSDEQDTPRVVPARPRLLKDKPKLESGTPDPVSFMPKFS